MLAISLLPAMLKLLPKFVHLPMEFFKRPLILYNNIRILDFLRDRHLCINPRLNLSFSERSPLRDASLQRASQLRLW